MCLLRHISPLERLFILKVLSRIQRVMEVKMFCGVFSENTSFKSYGIICHAVASYHADAQFFNGRAFLKDDDG